MIYQEGTHASLKAEARTESIWITEIDKVDEVDEVDKIDEINEVDQVNE